MIFPKSIQLQVPDDTPPDLILGFRVCHPDMRSSNGFRWPYPGQWAEAEGPIFRHRGSCPNAVGDGICVAHTTTGAASGGHRPGTYLLIGYRPDDVLGDSDPGKVRVRRALVLDVFTFDAFIGSSANLSSADLSSANLRSADLSSANLSSADLSSANLSSANLSFADLSFANLRFANLRSADLSFANLSSANGNTWTVLPYGWHVDQNSRLVVRNDEVGS